MPARITAWTCALLTVLLLGAPEAGAKEDLVAARKAADAVRAALPEPTPAISIGYEGDIVVDGLWMGEVKITARAAKVGRQSVWRVTQSTFFDAGVTGEVRTHTKLHLARDLAILSGTFEYTSKTRAFTQVMSRIEKGFMIQRHQRQGSGGIASELLELEAPARATGGFAAMLLFSRAVPAAKGGVFALPWVANQEWLLEGRSRTDEPFVLTVGGQDSFESRSKTHDSWYAATRQGSESPKHVHLTRDRRTLIGMESKAGNKLRVVPRGEGGSREVEVEQDAPAATWKAAFLKFGYGYHMARPALLRTAFHWDRMYAHETEVLKRWPAEKPLAAFKEAWVQEFLANSKHRTLADTKRLLAMTLATGKLTRKTADEVVFAAHPNFGGGVQRTYYFERRGGVWGIVRMDF